MIPKKIPQARSARKPQAGPKIRTGQQVILPNDAKVPVLRVNGKKVIVKVRTVHPKKLTRDEQARRSKRDGRIEFLYNKWVRGTRLTANETAEWVKLQDDRRADTFPKPVVLRNLKGIPINEVRTKPKAQKPRQQVVPQAERKKSRINELLRQASKIRNPLQRNKFLALKGINPKRYRGRR